MKRLAAGRAVAVLCGAVVAFHGSALTGAPVAAEETSASGNDGRPITEEQAKLEDAEWYASQFGISVEEALQRTDALAAREPVLEQAVATAGDRYAGTWLDHQPDLRQVFLVTGDDVPAELQRIAASSPIPFDVVTGAAHSWTDLRAAQDRIIETVRNEYPWTSLGLDLRNNAVSIRTAEPLSSEGQDAFREAAKVRVTFGEGQPLRLMHTRGGR